MDGKTIEEIVGLSGQSFEFGGITKNLMSPSFDRMVAQGFLFEIIESFVRITIHHSCRADKSQYD
ncbi:hypothetical protein ACQKMD_05785 [Viridibacillus sp. NPDC096237]|uniref:hypothetical protein n=1 Tax=Viridibacillus sp. NPDC096237 TaxID=3390721 RepID=UPI003D064DD6